MAAILARHSRVARGRVDISAQLRSFSRTVPAFKKRKNASSHATFDDVSEDDLFAPSSSSEINLDTTTFEPPVPVSQKKEKQQVADSLFKEQYKFVEDRLGPSPIATHPLVRENAIRRLLHYSNGVEQLDRIPDLLVLWRNSGRQVDGATTVELIDRCLAWNPPLLVQLFADRPRYGLTIPSLSEARRILRRIVFVRPHSVAQSADPAVRATANAQALRDATRFAALLPAHGLPSATADIACCALLAQACARNLILAPAADGAEQKEAKKKRNPELAEESSRGLIAITDELWRAFKAGEPISARGSNSKCVGNGNHAASVVERRESGFTQSRIVEMKWITQALSDIVQALKAANMKSVEKFSSLLARRLGVAKTTI